MIKTCWREFAVSNAFCWVFFVIFGFFFSEIARLCSFIIDIFLYIIHQKNPVSKSLRYIIPWFLRNRSYRRRAPSYRRHPIKLPSSVIWDKLAYRRLAANLSGIIVQKTRKGTSLSFWYKVYNASVFLCCKFERNRWSQRGASRQKLLEASGRVGAILTTVASCGCPQCTSHKMKFAFVNMLQKTTKLKLISC